jgi:hypothetical protein
MEQEYYHLREDMIIFIDLEVKESYELVNVGENK